MFDPEAFLDLANQVTKLKMWPYFDIAHCVMCCLAVREDLGSGKLIISRFLYCLSLQSAGLCCSALMLSHTNSCVLRVIIRLS